jgi:hypothetical protein
LGIKQAGKVAGILQSHFTASAFMNFYEGSGGIFRVFIQKIHFQILK